MSKAESIKWTGKNLADVKRLHKDVAHYPDEDEAYTRDASQHPDNLHLEVDGRTLIAGIGDTITKDGKGNITVEKGDTEPRQLDASPSSGRTHRATARDGLRGKGRG